MSENNVPQQAQPQKSALNIFNSYLIQPSMQGYLQKVLGERKDSFSANVVSLVSNNLTLQRCEPASVIFAAIKATALNLPLDQNLGFAYVIPYGKQAQFQVGYKGFVQLALRTNLYKTINVRDVRQGEIVGEDYYSGELQFKSLPYDARSGAPVIGYLAFFELTNGFRKSVFWSTQEVQSHAQRFSKSYGQGGGVWQSSFDAMARKTVLKSLLGKFGPMSVEMQTALTSDQAVIGEGTVTYVDNGGKTVADSAVGAVVEASSDSARVISEVREAESRMQ